MAVRYALPSFFGVALSFAGNIPTLTLEGLAGAPLLAVGRVERIRLGGPVPPERMRWNRPLARCHAEVKVLRAYPRLDVKAAEVSFYCADTSVSGGVAGTFGGPVFPWLVPKDIHLFGITPEGSAWRLVAEAGFGLTMPAIATPLPGRPPPFSARDFVIRELVNGLLQGSYPDVCRYGPYVREALREEQAREVLVHLRENLGPGDSRWIEIAGAMLARMGIPESGLEGLLRAPRGAVGVLAGGALERIPATRREEAIIRHMLRHSVDHEWGAAATLVPEFKDHPLLLSLLPDYLERRQRGAVTIAWQMLGNGQTLLEKPALHAGLRALVEAKPFSDDLRAACELVVERGSEAQFSVFLHALRQAREQDALRYKALWNWAYSLNNRRAVRLWGVLLEDERVMTGKFRHCDIAVESLQRITGESFGFDVDHLDLASRTAAVGRARAWLARRLADDR